jgi:D-amino-acid dehydrogenase
MRASADVWVIGGGVIGVCAAHSLAERGVAVGLVERDEIASGASHGNAGWIFPSHSLPIPRPGAIRQSARWLLDPESPLYIRPSPRPSLLRWLWRFRAACKAASARRSFGLRRALGTASLELYAKLAARPGLDFGWSARGLVVACRSREGLRELGAELDLLEAAGGRCERLDAAELHRRLPGLGRGLRGGAYLPDDAHLTPGDFVRGLARDLGARGVPVATHTEVLAIERLPGRGLLLWTTRGDLEAKSAVLAAGAWSPQLARAAGLRLPVEAAKGYSVTVRRPPGSPELPVMLAEAKVIATPMGETLRFAGTLELAGLDLGVNRRRVRALERGARELLPDLPSLEVLETWRGLRPLTPDDLPIIGRSRRCPELLVATGHGMSGMCQGPITGELVAQLAVGEPPSLDPAPFSPDRFG